MDLKKGNQDTEPGDLLGKEHNDNIDFATYNYQKSLDELLKQLQNDPDVVGAMLFGSYIKNSSFRDIDIAVFMKFSLSEAEMIRKRLFFLKNCPEIFDLQIYNLLPLTVQKEVLSGKVLFETQSMYHLAYETIREYEDFEKYLIEYRKAVLS